MKSIHKISSVIIEDEPGGVITLRALLNEYCPNIIVLGDAPDPIKGCTLIRSVKPDLVFLDIEMLYGNGFDLLDMLKPIFFEVIFVTAFNQYAIKAFKYSALDYVLKPINISDLKEAVSKVEKRIGEKNINTKVADLLEYVKLDSTIPKIGLPTPEGHQIENIKDLIYLQAKGSSTEVFIKNKKSEVVSRNLKELEDLLPAQKFTRIHHSTIINNDHVKRFWEDKGTFIEMTDGTVVEVSQRKRSDFFKRFLS